MAFCVKSFQFWQGAGSIKPLNAVLKIINFQFQAVSAQGAKTVKREGHEIKVLRFK
jgi:hypothetical protein